MGGVDILAVIAGIDLALAAIPQLLVENRTDLDTLFVPRIGPAPN